MTHENVVWRQYPEMFGESRSVFWITQEPGVLLLIPKVPSVDDQRKHDRQSTIKKHIHNEIIIRDNGESKTKIGLTSMYHG